MSKYLALFPAAALLFACGSDKDDDDDGDDGLAVPASIVTEAELVPGSLKAYDADDVKSMLENDGDTYAHNAPEDADDEGCFADVLKTLTAMAQGDTIVFDGSVDYSSCLLASYKEQEGWADADYSELTIASSLKLAFYIKCEGADLTAYNGKAFSDISRITECNQATVVKTLSESNSYTKISGKVKNVDFDGTKYTMLIDNEQSDVNASRTAVGKPCEATRDGATFTWKDGCQDVSKSVTAKDSTGIEGAEQTVGEDVGKAEYEKRVYSGVKQAADATSLWYTGGKFDVTLNDWTGTVTYTSATSEPIFQMTKGTETVTGTVKAPTAD